MSKVLHKPTGRSLRYGELVRDAIDIKLDKEPAIKTPDQYKLMGKPMARLDTPLKINGSAIYGIDINVPDAVHAAIMACPVFGGRVKSVDEFDDRGTARCDPGGQAPQCRGGDCRPLLARQGCARQACDRVGLGAAANTDSAQFQRTYREAALETGGSRAA